MNTFSKQIAGAVCSAGIVGLLSAAFLDETYVHVPTPHEVAAQLAAAPVDAQAFAAHLARADAHYRLHLQRGSPDVLAAGETLVRCDDARRARATGNGDVACQPALADVGKEVQSAERA